MVIKGSTLRLACGASGFPVPFITWSRLLGSLPLQRSQQVNGTLIIRKFQLSDGGSYKCSAVNSFGVVTAYTTLNYREIPCKYKL
jgi:hypothetical protein